ncbi:hypothetical protein FALBO_1400 [Fusarium albosuccineum]|uniref:Uncharacterized protein n=1 Tax=Fusarium albosuccineum TaxID=1237068 RepID=A0A8H4LN12_9HYPO|nr:hypothetical protein FALBO_1400 [Fusarium albosuccineum]
MHDIGPDTGGYQFHQQFHRHPELKRSANSGASPQASPYLTRFQGTSPSTSQPTSTSTVQEGPAPAARRLGSRSAVYHSSTSLGKGAAAAATAAAESYKLRPTTSRASSFIACPPPPAVAAPKSSPSTRHLVPAAATHLERDTDLDRVALYAASRLSTLLPGGPILFQRPVGPSFISAHLHLSGLSLYHLRASTDASARSRMPLASRSQFIGPTIRP